MTTVLLLQCSETKRPDSTDAAALDLYDGPLFRTVRHWFSQNGRPPELLVRILSSEHGLVAGETPISPYDRKMRRDRATELRPQVLRALQQLPTPVSAVFIAAAGPYRLTLDGVEDLFEPATITWAGGHDSEKHGSGGLGDWQRQVREWLTTHHPKQGGPTNGTAVTVLDQVEKQLSSITTVTEAKDARDRVAALHRYAKHSRQKLQTRNKVALLQFRLERRAGELLHAIPKVQGQRDGADGLVEHIRRSGLTTFTAYRWMGLAEIPEAELLRAGAQCDANGEELTSTLVYGWLVKHSTEQTPTETLPPARDLLGSSDLLVKLRVLEPGTLDGLSPEMQNVVVTELRGVYDDYCEDERRGKIATEDGWNPPIVINVTRLRTLTREMLSAGTLTPGAVRQRLRGFLDEVVSRWEQRISDPTSATKKPRSGGYGTGRTKADVEYDRRFTSRFPPFAHAAQHLIETARVLVKPYGLLNEPPQLDEDAVLAVAGTVRAALDVMERRVKELQQPNHDGNESLSIRETRA